MTKTEQNIKAIVDRVNTDGQIHSAEIPQVARQTRVILEERKLKRVYPRINMYGNWLVHSQLSQSAECFEILESVADVFSLAMASANLDIPTEISKIFALGKLRSEFQMLYTDIGISTLLFDDDADWKEFVTRIILEIIERPIAFPSDVTVTGKRYCDKIFANINAKAKGVDLWIPMKVSLFLYEKGEEANVRWKIESKRGAFFEGNLLLV